VLAAQRRASKDRPGATDVPQVVIIAGPNGAGKTTFASEYLTSFLEPFEFVNADEIARSIAQYDLTLSAQQVDVRSARIMLERINTLVAKRSNFALETTLASRAYSRKLRLWQKIGYTISLIYLRLASPEEAIERVCRRVLAGGHDIPEEVIRRRFHKSAKYFESTYKAVVNEWHVRDSREGKFGEAES
jgi:predicted ABC-type ATPase